MRWLLDLAIAFLTLGLLEAVVKPLARRSVQRRILAGGAPEAGGPHRRALGHSDLVPLFALVDPRAAADHALGQMGDEAFAAWLDGASPEELERWQP